MLLSLTCHLLRINMKAGGMCGDGGHVVCQADCSYWPAHHAISYHSQPIVHVRDVYLNCIPLISMGRWDHVYHCMSSACMHMYRGCMRGVWGVCTHVRMCVSGCV